MRSAPRRAPSATAAVRQAYDDPVALGDGDEFVKPTVIVDGAGRAVGPLTADDAVILFNFRADRVRQLLAVLTHGTFAAFDRGMPPIEHVATLTEVVRGQSASIAFAPIDVEWPLARVVSERGSRQYHTAESEKRAHVTYFFNGGREEPFAGEDRHIVPSPGVATYDLQPEMSAVPVTEAVPSTTARRAASTRVRSAISAFMPAYRRAFSRVMAAWDASTRTTSTRSGVKAPVVRLFSR